MPLLVILGCGSRAIDVGDDESDATTSPEESTDESATESTDTTTDESSESESTDTTTGEPSKCGNGQIDEGEQCDGADLNGFDCTSVGYTGGVLACDPQTCTLDGSGCGYPGLTCGNGVIDGLEESCDGSELDGQSCVTLGFVAGTLECTPPCMDEDDFNGCTNACKFDLSHCLVEGEGNPCTSDDDCLPSAPICMPDGCSNGAEGDSCLAPDDCMESTSCVEGTCFDGSENDPCLLDADCQPSWNQCAFGHCLDGSIFSPCEDNGDCDGNLFCIDGMCFGV